MLDLLAQAQGIHRKFIETLGIGVQVAMSAREGHRVSRLHGLHEQLERACVVHGIFAIRRLAFDALFQRDYNLLLAVFFVSSVMVVLFNLVADLLYSIADPRIELQ